MRPNVFPSQNDPHPVDAPFDAVDEIPAVEAPLEQMSSPELQLMQDITLHQMRETHGETTLLLLGRVWYRLEQERRRRASEVSALERMYFAR